MGKQETAVSDAIRLELSARKCITLRHQVGLFYTKNGKEIYIGKKGESDLQGHRSDGKVFYLETKTPIGKASKEQKNFINAMKKSGAIAGFAHSVEEAIDIVFNNK